jgi:hypothetical protein
MSDLYNSTKYLTVPQTLKNNHKFCSVCGLEMRYNRAAGNGSTFDKITGKETKRANVYTHRWLCQSGEEGHDSEEFVPVA